MIETLVVALVVSAAFVYATWALLPAGTRLKLVRSLVSATGGTGAPAALRSLAARLERGARGDHCAGCDLHDPPPGAADRRRK